MHCSFYAIGFSLYNLLRYTYLIFCSMGKSIIYFLNMGKKIPDNSWGII